MLRPGLHFSRVRVYGMLAVLLVACLLTASAYARMQDLKKYPLHVHVLAADETHRTPRMAPGVSLACDGMDDMDALSGGGYGDPCASHPEMVMARLMNATDDDPVFSGEGRADLVTPPKGTQGFTFHYDNCSRMRVRNGFQSLPARWKKPGKTLEVLVPSDEIPKNGKPLAPVRCTMSVTMHDFVYLLLRDGRVIEVSEDGYWAKPALRVFLSGNAQAMQRRPADTVSVKQVSGKPAQ
jgi:hypothetical protein